MKLKLRDIVSYVHAQNGIVFRMGDTLLPIKGRDAAECFSRLRPLLNGQWSLDEICNSVSGTLQPYVRKLLLRLIEADIVYETADASASVAGTDGIGAPIDWSYLARVESVRDDARAQCSELLNTRLVGLGEISLLSEIADACSESGLMKFVYSDAEDPAVLLQSHRLCPATDVLILAANLDQDGQMRWITEILKCEMNIPVAPFLQVGRSMIAGPFSTAVTGDSLRGIVQAVYANSGPLDNRSLKLCRQTAARMLLQRLFDIRTHMISDDEHGFFFEMDCESFEISVHPSPSLPARCIFGSPSTSDKRDLETDIEDAILERSYKRLVDSKTGLIRKVEEGDLLQLPHNQSAGELRLTNDPEPFWITRTGKDLRAARVAVVRSAVEEYLLNSLELQPPPDINQVNWYPAEHTGSRKTLPVVTRLVSSALDYEQLATETFLRCMARLAAEDPKWIETPPQQLFALTRSDAAARYLEDIQPASHVSVRQNHALSSYGLTLLEMSYDDRLVTVICGADVALCLEIGFKEIWLHVSALKAGKAGKTSEYPRFRAAPGAWSFNSNQRDRILQDCGFVFGIVPVSCAATEAVRPYIFGYSLLCQEVSEEKDCVPTTIRTELIMNQSRS